MYSIVFYFKISTPFALNKLPIFSSIYFDSLLILSHVCAFPMHEKDNHWCLYFVFDNFISCLTIRSGLILSIYLKQIVNVVYRYRSMHKFIHIFYQVLRHAAHFCWHQCSVVYCVYGILFVRAALFFSLLFVSKICFWMIK